MQHTFIAFDTLCQLLVLDHLPDASFKALAMDVERSARRVEATLSMFDDRSELANLCRHYETGSWYPVSTLLHAFLMENKKMHKWSGGVFDPTVGRAVKLWDFLSEEPALPDAYALTENICGIGFHLVDVDAAAPRIRFQAPGLLLDPGASGKGFALQEGVRILRNAGIESAYLNYGGNLFALGLKQEETRDASGTSEIRYVKWKVGIQNPHNRSEVSVVEFLSDEGISTSSWYEHGFVKDGQIFHHILDPKTGYPAKMTLSSVSIISNDAFYTDLVSTAYFLLGREKGEAMLSTIQDEKHVSLRSVVIDFEPGIRVNAAPVTTPKSSHTHHS